MTLHESLSSALKDAMINKNVFQTSVLRMLLSAIHNREIEKKSKGQELSEDDVFDVLRKEVKKRKEAAVMYKSGGRMESADEEEKEVQFIETFLPAQMSESDIEAAVSEVMAGFSSPTVKDFGTIMKQVMAKTSGQADGAAVSAVIKKYLAQ